MRDKMVKIKVSLKVSNLQYSNFIQVLIINELTAETLEVFKSFNTDRCIQKCRENPGTIIATMIIEDGNS